MLKRLPREGALAELTGSRLPPFGAFGSGSISDMEIFRQLTNLVLNCCPNLLKGLPGSVLGAGIVVISPIEVAVLRGDAPHS